MAENSLNPIYCIKCKKQIGDADTFCKHCGQSQAPQAATTSTPSAAPTPKSSLVILPGEPNYIPPPPQPSQPTQGQAYPINNHPPYQPQQQQVVIVQQKNNYTPLIITLLAIFTPLGCLIPIVLLAGGTAVFGVALLVLGAVFALWPLLLGAAACAVIYRARGLLR